MAALSDFPLPRVVDLRNVRPTDLDALLEEEVKAWDRKLRWNFGPSAELVRRFVEMKALAGYALLQSNQVIGYVYYVCEERKGLIGDLYVMDAHRSTEKENLLLGPVLDTLFSVPFVRRVESQLMMIGQPVARPLPRANQVRVFERDFMESDLAAMGDLSFRENPSIRIEQWTESDQDEAARVIADAYSGHIDSRINDQYQSPAGARRFLLNIVQYPGCGTFFQPASFVAVEAGGRMCGICLSSLVQDGIGHVTQICVTPEVRGTGVGYSLLRRSLQALNRNGCSRVSLTVTAANQQAIELYERVGFNKTRSFAAYVWESHRSS
jgi:ribosomal protein S18 acetylase RimI-like enzyme